MTIRPLRTRFGKEIVAEFWQPVHPSRKARPELSRRVIIYCDGAPTIPYKRPLLESFAKRGYWIFHIRFRGCWESGGKFLRLSPERDVLEVINQLPRGFVDDWSGKRFRVKPSTVVLIGSSFGGPAVLLASRDPRITKVIAVSPVVDWCAPSRTEPLPWLKKFMRRAFGEAYRFTDRDWQKLSRGRFYSPMMHAAEIDGRKILMIHARDDQSVAWQPVAQFAALTGAELILLRHGGHLGPNILTQPRLWPQIRKFLARL